MNEGFVTKDSGQRLEFSGGMVRDTPEGKINWSLVRPGPMLKRWAELMTRGSVKYETDRKPGELRNWQKAQGVAELERFIESADRHFAQWINGDTDEDHGAAVFFNINGAESLGGPNALMFGAEPFAEQPMLLLPDGVPEGWCVSEWNGVPEIRKITEPKSEPSICRGVGMGTVPLCTPCIEAGGCKLPAPTCKLDGGPLCVEVDNCAREGRCLDTGE